MKIGITGSTGVIGTIVKEKLFLSNLSISTFNGDIRKKQDLYDWLSLDKFDILLHFAALVPTVQVEKDPLKAYSVNVGGVINLMEVLCETKQKPWVFYSSTSHVYKSSLNKLKESDLLEPISKYGLTKLMGEYVFSDSNKYGFEICIGRIFSFFHYKQIKPFLYPTIIERLKNENLSNPFLLIGADDVRDIINAEIISDLIIELMNKKATGIYNIGSGEGTKIRDFVQFLTNEKLNIITEENKEKSFLVANIDKLNKVINS